MEGNHIIVEELKRLNHFSEIMCNNLISMNQNFSKIEEKLSKIVELQQQMISQSALTTNDKQNATILKKHEDSHVEKTKAEIDGIDKKKYLKNKLVLDNTNTSDKEDKKNKQKEEGNDHDVDSMNDDHGDNAITLNVGGKIFTTTRETLCQKVGDHQSNEHYFAALFNSGFPISVDQNGHILIDRDSKHFRLIMNYLRCGGNTKEFVLPFHSETDMKEIEQECKFYNLNELVDYICCSMSNRDKCFDSSNCTPNIELLNNNICFRHTNTSWGTIKSKKPFLIHLNNASMVSQTNYFEIKIEKTENQNIMIGLVPGDIDVRGFGPCSWIGNLEHTYSFYCFDGRKYIDKERINGFGEDCRTNDVVGIWLDVFNDSLYFYKNGKCMGLGAEKIPLDQHSEWYFAISVCDKDCTVSLLSDRHKPPILPGMKPDQY